MAVQYDPQVDYSELIAQEAAKGVNANRNLLAQYESQRNAKIAGEGLNYAQTNIYTNGSGSVTGSTAPNVTDVGVGSIISMGKPGGYYTATSQADYINKLYDASLKAQQAALESAYNANLAAYDQQASKIPAVYQAAKNQTASSAEIARQGLNERFAASGLNTGTQGQAALAMSTATQGSLSSLDAQRAQAVADIEAERAQTMAQYQSAVAEAIAKNEMQRAQALYEEAMRVDSPPPAEAAAGIPAEAPQTLLPAKVRAALRILCRLAIPRLLSIMTRTPPHCLTSSEEYRGLLRQIR